MNNPYFVECKDCSLRHFWPSEKLAKLEWSSHKDTTSHNVTMGVKE